jgi:hypothetical protein
MALHDTLSGVSISRFPGSAIAAPVTSLAPPRIPTLYLLHYVIFQSLNFVLAFQERLGRDNTSETLCVFLKFLG